MTTNITLAQTIPADQIRNAGEPVFPELRRRLFGYHEEKLLALVNAREAYGVSKYGQTLLTDDGRDTPTEIVNELLDGMAYMTKLTMQADSSLMEYKLMQLITLTVEIIDAMEAKP